MERPTFHAWLEARAKLGYSYGARHFRAITALAQRALDGEVDRIRIHMPPRHGKTQTFTCSLPLYILLILNPRARILITAYSDRFARKLSRQIRNEFLELGGKVATDKFASDEWYTASGGMVMARGVGTPPTGEGFDWIFIDDPVRKREDAESEVYREKMWDWYTDDLYTRLQPDGVMALIMTLWHEDDLGGRLSAAELRAEESDDEHADRWATLVMPAIAEENDALGRKPGDALWPEQWSLEKLLRRRRAMVKRDGERSWFALYQQQPSPAAGDVFNVTKLRFCDPEQVPKGLRTVRAWDVASSTKKRSDFTAAVEMAGPDEQGNFYVLHVLRVKLKAGERDQLIRTTAEADGREVAQGVPDDPGAAGDSQVIYWVRLLAGFTIQVMPTSGDKLLRMGPFASQVNQGNVIIVRGPWNTDFVEELRTIPGAHDDQADAAGDAFKMLTLKHKLKVF